MYSHICSGILGDIELVNNFPPVHGDAVHDQHSQTIYLKGEGVCVGGGGGGVQICNLPMGYPH